MKKQVTYLLILLLFSATSSGQSYFQNTPYRGAFGSVDWTEKWTNWFPVTSSYPGATVTVQGSILSNTTWTNNKTYLVKGYVYVKNNATLTIEPGTVIRFDVQSTSTLIITRGAKINAVGTENQPIVFTSNEDPGYRNYGDWGGLVILGKAKINVPGGTADVGASINNSSGDGLYGGNNDEDSSGNLRYIRIEFAGIQYQPDKEICGLTLAGVGSKTNIDFVQISFCGNDGFRCSGGAARMKHIISHRGYDNDLQLDLGYHGLMQFGVFLRDSTKANATGSSGIEISNDGLGTASEPITDPTISNFTILGPLTELNTAYNNNFRYGLHVKNNARVGFFNSAIAGFPKGLVLNGYGLGQQLNASNIIVRNCIIAGSKSKQTDTTGGFAKAIANLDLNSWFTDGTQMGELFAKPKALELQNPYNYNDPLFIPKTGSPMLTGASFSHIRLSKTESTVSPLFQDVHFYSYQEKLFLENKNGNNLVVNIYAMSGQILRTLYSREANNRWDVSLPSGVYLVRIIDLNSQKTISKKLAF